jgi:L-ribulose-5-phosphate 4-epimerase
MTIKELREKALLANLDLVTKKLVIITWGNVSAYDPETGNVAIKASGVKYEEMKAEHMTVLDLDGNIVEGKYKPSTDTPTHLVLYRAFKDQGIMGLVHTHSQYATMWAQSGTDVPCLGTTHGDYFYGDIPVSRLLTVQEIQGEYEKNTGDVILETLATKKTDCRHMSAVLVHSHGPFVWGGSPMEAVEHSLVLEYICKMAYCNVTLAQARLPWTRPAVNGEAKPLAIQQELLDKHYNRKFGPGAYYGQK